MFIDGFERYFYIFIVAVVDRVERVVAKHIACHKGFKLCEQEVARNVDVIPTSRHTILCGIGHKVHQEGFIVRKHSKELLVVFKLFEFLAVGVGKAICILLDKASVSHCSVIRSDACGVASHEDIWHDAATAIHFTSVCGFKKFVFVYFDTITAIQFAVVES